MYKRAIDACLTNSCKRRAVLHVPRRVSRPLAHFAQTRPRKRSGPDPRVSVLDLLRFLLALTSNSQQTMPSFPTSKPSAASSGTGRRRRPSTSSKCRSDTRVRDTRQRLAAASPARASLAPPRPPPKTRTTTRMLRTRATAVEMITKARRGSTSLSKSAKGSRRAQSR